MMRPRSVARGVEAFATRTPTLPPATHTQSYALGDRDVLLVEPAPSCDDERLAWLAWARAIAGAGRRIVAIFATHHHADHVGGASFLAAALGVPIWAHREVALRAPRVPISRVLVGGETLVLDGPSPTRWNVMVTPGHAPGHLCLHEADRGIVVCGDMIAGVGTIVIDAADGGDMADYVAQLRRLAGLAARVALPAHGEPVDDPRSHFERYIAHREMREAKVLASLARSGPSGARIDELVPFAYDDTPPIAWPLARSSLEAHLIKLEREGRARRGATGWLAAAPASP